MATISLQTPERTQGHRTFFWEEMGDADTGIHLASETFSDRSVQALGTFDSATVTVQGSNDGTTWATLNDLQGSAATLTAAGLIGIAEMTRYIRVITSGGQGSTDLDVYLHCIIPTYTTTNIYPHRICVVCIRLFKCYPHRS